jgi:hypothetical protein
MQDAIVGSWAQESHLSVESLGSLHDLNHRFLDLAAARANPPGLRRVQLYGLQLAAASRLPHH